MKTELFNEALRKRWVEQDLAEFEPWFPRYKALHRVVTGLFPRKIVEIGVRAGYSAFTMLHAQPGAHLLGIDADIDPQQGNSHGGYKGAWQHAETILKGYNFDLLIADSHKIDRLPVCDLCYIDGDHTTEGCYLDLCLAAQTAKHILCDDYDTVFRFGRFEVREAIDKWVRTYTPKKTEHIPNGSTGLYLITL